MPKMVRQTSFSAGEADIKVWKRTDDPAYLTAAQSLLNCEVGTTGLAKKRRGTTFRYNATGEAVPNSTMYEFIDKNGTYYIILGAGGMFYVLSAPEQTDFVINYEDLYVVTYTGAFVTYNQEEIILIQAIPVDYTDADLFDIDYTQDNDSLILTSPNYPPGRIYVSSYDPLTFAFQYLDIYPLPAYDFNQVNYNNTTVALSSSGTGTGLSGETLTAVFTFNPAGGPPVLLPAGTYNNAWVGGQILGGGQSDLAPLGYAIILTVTQTTGGGGTYSIVTFTALIQIAFDISTADAVGSQYSIKQPAWVNTLGNPYGLGYPAKVLYFQNRLWFANTALLPITIFGSKLNQPVSFDVAIGADTDAIIYTIGQSDTVAIQWLNGGKQLEIFTNNYEFACPQNEDVGLTPSSFSIRQQSSFGSSTILKPQTYLNDTYFVQKTGKAMVNYHFTGVGLAYQSSNVAPQSQHLMKNPVNRAILRGTDVSQDNFIYLLNQVDNTLTSFQFAIENKLAALTPVEFEENVTLIDIVTVNNHVYILKYFTLTQQYTIDRFDTGIYIDSSESFPIETTGVINGLSRFNGYVVQVVYENQDYGQFLVVDGTITVTPLPPDFVPESSAQVGLLYDVEIKPMYPFFSSTSSPFEKILNRVYIDYYESLDFFINGKLVQYQDFHEIQLGLPLVPKTDTAIFSPVEGYYRFDGEAIVITQSSPFDLQILSIGYEINMAVI